MKSRQIAIFHERPSSRAASNAASICTMRSAGTDNLTGRGRRPQTSPTPAVQGSPFDQNGVVEDRLFDVGKPAGDFKRSPAGTSEGA